MFNLPRNSIGIGDRFGHQGCAQLDALIRQVQHTVAQYDGTLFLVSQGVRSISLEFFASDPPGDLSATGGGIRNAIVNGTIAPVLMFFIFRIGADERVVVRGLDQAVWEAKRRGIRLVIPLVNNWQAREIRTAAEARQGLIEQIPGTVRWVE